MSAKSPSGVTRPTLRREIGFPQLIAYGLVFIGPAAAVGVHGTLDAKSGGVVPMVYLVAMGAMALTAASYAAMSRVVPSAGSVFAYARAGIGRRTGHMGGWMVLLDYLLVPSVAYLFCGIALHSAFPAIPVWGYVAAALAITTVLNLAGVRVTARVSMVVVVIEVVVLLVVLAGAVAALITHGPERGWLDPFTGGDAGLHPQLVLAAVSVAVLSFLGFDAVATFAEETKGSTRTVARATLVCLVVAGVLFMAQTYLGAVLSPYTTEELRADPSLQGDAFYVMVDAHIGPAMHTLLALVKALGAMFSALVGQAAASRILMAMGREGSLPSALARISPRTGAPLVATMVAAAGNVAVSLWASRRDDGLDVVVSIVDVGALVGFTLVHLSVIGFFLVRRRGEDRSLLRHGFIPVLGAAVLVLVLINTSGLALVIGVVWALIGAALLLLRGPGSDADPLAEAESASAREGSTGRG